MMMGSGRGVRVDAAIAALCGPGKDVPRPSTVFFARETCYACELKDGKLHFFKEEGEDTEHKLDAKVDGFWRVSQTKLVFRAGRDMNLFDLETREQSTVCQLPERACEVCVTHNADTGTIVACMQPDSPSSEAPVVLPAEPAAKRLLVYRPLHGWTSVSILPETAERLVIAQDGCCCAYAVMRNVIPEEAERGEVFVCPLAPAATPHQVTSGAGRVGDIGFTTDGAALLYTANYSGDRPITTHCPLYAVRMHNTIAMTTDDDRIRISEPGTHVELFTSLQGSALLLTTIVGVKERSYFCPDWRQPGEMVETRVPACTAPLLVDAGAGSQHLVYITETNRKFPCMVCVASSDGSVVTEIPFPHEKEFDDIQLDVLSYTSHDGTSMEMLHAYTTETKQDASLLVHAHGGPAVAFTSRRTAAASNVRYPYRHLLKAGYRIIMPLFRGTLGYGDEFAQANIGCQGREDSDLGDILAAVRSLKSSGFDFGDRVGVFGGSYGGYMTLRSLAVTKAFKAGVAMYGFVHGRFMTLEGGDFTWEDEYVGEQCWPMTDATTDSDVFHHLGSITSPTLLLHGDEDDICLKSSSLVAYRALHTRGVPTGCVIYPGEGHGFENPIYQRDRDLRTLKWFLTHLPPLPPRAQ